MFQELVVAAGIEYACLAYGLNMETLKNVTVESKN
jgi:hypothetical protein